MAIKAQETLLQRIDQSVKIPRSILTLINNPHDLEFSTGLANYARFILIQIVIG